MSLSGGLNGTTIDEVQRLHRDTLVLCVKETNRIFAEQEKRQQTERDAQERAEDEHRRRVQEAARRIRFDE